MNLIVTPEPKPDESGRGYYRRLASENGMRGLRELAAMADVARTAAALLNCPEHVAEQLDLQPQWAVLASQREKQAASWRALRRSNSEAVCPCCLQDDIYIRASWEHVFYTACPKHKRSVVDRCPDCGDLLSTNREFIESCNCGRDLRTIDAPSCTPSQLWLSSLIETQGRSTASIAPSVEGVDVSTVTGFVRDLCRSFDPSVPSTHKAAATFRSTREAIEFLSPMESLLADWPTGFRAHVSARIKAGDQEARTLNQVLDGWFQRLRKSCAQTPLEPFLRQVYEVAYAEFDGVILGDSAQYLASQIADALHLSEAARQIGVSYGALYQAAQANQCAHFRQRRGTRGHIESVPKSEVARIIAARAEWVGEQEACEVTGVSPAVMRLMMDAGVVESDRAWRKDILKGGPIRKLSLAALCQTLCGTSSRAKRGEAGLVYWSDMSMRRLGDRHSIQAAMRAAASGELAPEVRGKRLGEVGFDKQELAKYHTRPLLESGLTVNQLSKQTGWKWESISHWIDSGLLRATETKQRGQPCRMVTPEDLLKFRAQYIPLADLARSMDTKASYLAEQLTGIELVGAQILTDGARRGGLVSIADLGRLAIQGSRALATAG